MSNVVNCNRKAAFVCHVETLSVVEEIYDLFSMHHLPRNFLMKTSSSPLQLATQKLMQNKKNSREP